MQHDDKSKFLDVLAGVHDFYGKELSEFAGQVWTQACEGYELEQVTKALSAHLMDPERGHYMPKPSDIVRQLQGTNTDRSLIAWGKLLDAMQRVGAYTSVCFDDAAIHAAVEDVGGWQRMCRTSHDDLSYLQHRFCSAYKAYAARGEFAYPAKLLGETEIANGPKGYRSEPPVLIGNPEAASRVLKAGGEAKAQITHLSENVQKLLGGAS